MSNQQTTTKEVAAMKECKHENWTWRIIPDSQEKYQAVYCDICDQMLAQVGQDNKTVTETAKPQTKEKAMKESNLGRITCTRSVYREGHDKRRNSNECDNDRTLIQ